MSGFDQGTGAVVAALRSTGEPGKASPIRGGAKTLGLTITPPLLGRADAVSGAL